MNAREEILRRIEEAASAAGARRASGDADVAAAYARIDRRYLRRHHGGAGSGGAGSGGAGSGAVLDLFAERVADYRATVLRVRGSEVPGTVAERLAGRAGSYGVPSGLPAEWTSATRATLVRDPPVASLDGLAGAVTGCAVAIAETGTIVLDHGADQGPRALSLVPDHHVVVVLAGQVVADVPEALERLDPRRPLTLVSGPSATSDIELTRVEGVHGPRTLEVLLVE
ncbi:L-lactate dehydrogenase complex protein LldG [Actinomadura pelletieri DSM 43383]|uniref:L-lactate dehydrogenase complex protein LldG n=1 Tax=Actinomadura pelletieri DSM 43383 TaxID=1120940 RepID=A0A495QC80_9ACTN|nr:LUD domain-containing protein [Actinomadura pelletieri]RKS69114.1 L-lactate dehydrogenase complex protein LldG [Actinomadura pelletieri DSM 43383]